VGVVIGATAEFNDERDDVTRTLVSTIIVLVIDLLNRPM